MNKFTQEKTLVLIKPDGVKRGLIGEIFKRIEQRGLKIIALKMFWPTKEEIAKHYSDNPDYLKGIGEKSLATYRKFGLDPKKEMGTDDPLKIGTEARKWLIDFMTSGPLVKAIIQGVHAVEMVRKIVGGAIPSGAGLGA